MIAAYDPRDEQQDEKKPATWRPTRNIALIMAGVHREVQNKDERFAPVNWAQVARAADFCDQMVSLK